MPRIRDLKDQQLYCVESGPNKRVFASLLKKSVDMDLIEEQREAIIRVAISLKSPTAPAHLLVQRLSSRPLISIKYQVFALQLTSFSSKLSLTDQQHWQEIPCINPKHLLASLAHAIPCKKLEDKFIHLYSHTGAPTHHLTKWRGVLNPRSKEQLAIRSTGNRRSPYIAVLIVFF